MSVPKLRFPEFLDTGEWEIKEFSKYIVLYRGSSPRPIQSYLSSDSSGVNWIKIGDTKSAKNFVISQVEEKITPDGAKKSRKVNVGELILANSMSYGKTYLLAIDGCIYDGWFVLRNHEKYFDKQFLLQLLNSEYMQNQYERFSAGGIVQNISSDIVYKTVLPHTSLNEQKKIADCLSSIDDRITAETQKLDNLKAHKKGLMQQLFPAEGETLPKLRFPEFQDSGEWEEKKLGDITEKISDGIHSTPIYNENGQYYFVNGNNLAEDKIVINESTKRVDEIEYSKYKTELSSQTILISINGTIGNLAFFNGEKVVLGKSACYINLKPNENKYFVFNLLKTSSIQKYFEKELTGSTIKNLSLSSIKNAKAFFPIPAEQEKIADCLSSIDEAIAAQSQAIDLLKLHKKGLMQQLFPSVEEVRG